MKNSELILSAIKKLVINVDTEKVLTEEERQALLKHVAKLESK